MNADDVWSHHGGIWHPFVQPLYFCLTGRAPWLRNCPIVNHCTQYRRNTIQPFAFYMHVLYSVYAFVGHRVALFILPPKAVFRLRSGAFAFCFCFCFLLLLLLLLLLFAFAFASAFAFAFAFVSAFALAFAFVSAFALAFALALCSREETQKKNKCSPLKLA